MEAGTWVAVNGHISPQYKGLSYSSFTGKLLEYCNGEGWDVVDVLPDLHKKPVSVYSFSVDEGIMENIKVVVEFEIYPPDRDELVNQIKDFYWSNHVGHIGMDGLTIDGELQTFHR